MIMAIVIRPLDYSLAPAEHVAQNIIIRYILVERHATEKLL